MNEPVTLRSINAGEKTGQEAPLQRREPTGNYRLGKPIASA